MGHTTNQVFISPRALAIASAAHGRVCCTLVGDETSRGCKMMICRSVYDRAVCASCADEAASHSTAAGLAPRLSVRAPACQSRYLRPTGAMGVGLRSALYVVVVLVVVVLLRVSVCRVVCPRS